MTPVCFLSSSLLLFMIMTVCYACLWVVIKISPGYLEFWVWFETDSASYTVFQVAYWLPNPVRPASVYFFFFTYQVFPIAFCLPELYRMFLNNTTLAFINTEKFTMQYKIRFYSQSVSTNSFLGMYVGHSEQNHSVWFFQYNCETG